MSEVLKKQLGDTYCFCSRRFLEVSIAYSCSLFCIVKSRFPIDIEPGLHGHESYEFLLPITTMPQGKIEKEVWDFQPGKVYPFSSCQVHGVHKLMKGVELMSIMVEQNLMDDLTYAIIGKTGLTINNSSFNLYPELKLLIRNFIKESTNKQAGYDFVLESLRTQILINLIRNIKGPLASHLEKGQNILSNHHINRVIEMIRAYYNRDFTLDDLAREANLSQYHFIRAFKNQTGQTPHEFLMNIRIEKAKELMSKDLNITDICLQCGFNNHSHFTTVFKKKVGLTPTQYRKVLQS
ncbi:AraC family transcriptional regulator [Desulforamulus ferrireducens]|uniref:HTH araC/xylS-type domain-containing protein n=1 Tax=Desulforamulus ferrireducens TaxID=1833852 RepID=A0A1S6ISN6_9FIRM|nr:AraC family transcriptional regulator [Desulforamulus ferrireducens]AQS57791.1 hypothetical protein B0537_00915 [Desulforamulus ferrireducens]